MYSSNHEFKASKHDVTIVGTPYQLDAQCTLDRAPATSDAHITDGQLVASTPGVYKVRRHPHEDPMKIVVFPKASTEALQPFAPPSALEGILLALGKGVSTEMLDALTEARPLPTVNLALYGADSLPSAWRKAMHSKAVA